MTDDTATPESASATEGSIDWQATAETWKARAETAEARVEELETENAALRRGMSKAPSQKKLTDYKNGEAVEVVKNGDWLKGTVNGTEKKLGLVYVHTERGPVTVAGAANIRPVQS